jgi:hypothetical protein
MQLSRPIIVKRSCPPHARIFGSLAFGRTAFGLRTNYEHAATINVHSVCRMESTSAAYIPQPSVADAGTRQPIELAGWQVQGVSVAGQVSYLLSLNST